MTRHWLYLWLFMIWLAAVSGQGTTLPSGDTVDAISSTSGDDPQNQMTISAIAEESRDTTGAVSEVSAEIGGNPESETPFNAHPEQAEVEGWSTTESSASPESESESEPENTEFSATTTAEWQERIETRRRCTQQSMIGCNVTNHERCYMDQGQPRCMCLSGYEKDKLGTCLAVQYYKVELSTFLTYTTELDDKLGDQYRNVVSLAQAIIDKALESSRLSSVYMYTEILDLVRSEGDDVIVIFDIVLPRSYAPKAYVILADVKWGIRQVLTSSGTDGSTAADAGLLILERHLEALAVTAVNPCSSSRYNYCDVRADCHATYPTGFVCSCRSGYADISPDMRSNPGEVCRPGSCQCHNGGRCELMDVGGTVCRCRSWYFGRNCSIDGKVLFIALNAVIGGLIVLALIICCVCLKKMQQNENRSMREKKMLDAAVTRDFPTVITYKMPSTWMERWSHLPENGHRLERWSHLSDSNNHRLNGKLNMAYEEPLGFHGMTSSRRSDEYLSIPRPQLRPTTSEQTTDRQRQDQYKEHWAWTMQ